MYKTILVTLDGTPTDRAIIAHVKELALLAHSKVVLLHVADGWAARTYGKDAVSPEITEDTAYLKKILAEFQNFVSHRFVEMPAHLYLNAPAPLQTLLRLRINDVDPTSQKAFSEALQKLRP